MSKLLGILTTEIKMARNLAYYGRYDQSKATFGKIIDSIDLQILKITDLKLKEEWTKLLDEMKNQQNQVEQMISVLCCEEPKPKMIKHKLSRDQRPIESSKPQQKQFIISDSEGLEERQKEKKQVRFPYGIEPFKKYHDDDQIDSRENHIEKDPLDWGPRPTKQTKPVNNKSAVDPTARRQGYEKPWRANNKQGKEGNKGKGKDKDKDKDKKEDEKKTFLKSVYPDGVGPDADLISMLEREVIQFNPGVTFDDIAQLEVAKDLLYQAVIMPLQMPNYFTGLKKAWKGVLMFGPPGTGKTLLAKAIASTGRTTFFNVTAASFASKWRGESQKLVRLLFEMARFYAPTTLFIDEIDAIAAGSDSDSNNRKVLTQMLTSMDGANSDPKEDKKVVVIGATNRPWDLDEAIRRRLQKRIYIPLPSEVGRRELLKICLKSQQLAQGVDQQSIVNRTQGYSGADITNLCKEAAFMPMRRKLKDAGGYRKIENYKNFQQQVNVPLTMQDFNTALKSCKPTVGNQHLEKYQKWMEQYGEKGGV